ncbi:PAS domain S-box protein [Candidatus Dojkabacteria bacterium]|nr:PAS domain S-box protein [Candidatus Dojkabacteria bacterium]
MGTDNEIKKVGTVRSLKDFLRGFVEPFPWVEDSEVRRQSVVLSIFLLSLVAFTFVAGIIPMSISGDTPMSLLGAVVAEIGLVIAVLLVKTGRFRLVSKFVVWFMVVIIMLVIKQKPDLEVYLIVPIIVASLFQSLTEQTYTYIIIIILSFIVPWYFYGTSFFALLAGYGGFTAIVSILVFITAWNKEVIERIRTGELKESQGFLDEIVNSANDPIITLDSQLRIVSMNSATRNVFGYERAELIEKDISILLSDESIDIFLDFARKELEEKQLILDKHGESGQGKLGGIIPREDSLESSEEKGEDGDELGSELVEKAGSKSDENARSSPAITSKGFEVICTTSQGNELDIELSMASWIRQDTVYLTLIMRDVGGQKRSHLELEKYAKELEKLNKLMVDRELKMVELKEIIKELKGDDEEGEG